MKHLISIDNHSQQELAALIDRALYFKQHLDFPTYPQYTLANLFYENSTRTRVSFELAAKRLGMAAINLDLNASSETKGEIIADTLRTLRAMGIGIFVVRHVQNYLPAQLANLDIEGTHIINAGDGQNEHPSQALLDFMTIMEHCPDLKDIKIAIIGNIRHSRVANSIQKLSKLMGVGKLALIAPAVWLPEQIFFGDPSTTLAAGLKDADVVICLRVQKERIQAHEALDINTYINDYAISDTALKYAKPNAMVMHPGPINRGIEIDSAVADGKQSFILEQVRNGVFLRMAILEALISK